MEDKNNPSITDFTGDEPIIGVSPTAFRLKRKVEKLSNTNHNVLIIGEPGTGRKFLAQKVFNQSKEYNQVIIKIDCAELGKTIYFADLYGEGKQTGLLEKANNGILLLENIDMMNFEFQDEFLRILKDYTIRRVGDNKTINLHMRVISTAENDLLQKIDSGKFRIDLYLLISTLVVSIPPIRNRKQDIPSLFDYFQEKFSKEVGVEKAAVSEEVFNSLLAYDWKGNVAELKESIKKLVTMSPKGELSAEFLPYRKEKHPFDFIEPQRFRSVIPEVQTFLIKKALSKTNGNQVNAAKLLGLPEPTFRFKMRKFRLIGK
jgi:DNA-binding NtrC family response regulator